MISIKRAYDPPTPQDGVRILVDRVWPRGLTKESLELHSWLKDVAPSTALRKWFAHDPKKWAEFQRKYFAELEANKEALEPIRDSVKKQNVVTLIYSARDSEHNNALALKEYLKHHQ